MPKPTKTSHPDHEHLLHHLGRLQGIRRQLQDARRQLHEKASAQLESMPAAIDHVGAHVERGQGGGPLAERAHQRLLIERGRLHHLVLTDTDSDTDTPPDDDGT